MRLRLIVLALIITLAIVCSSCNTESETVQEPGYAGPIVEAALRSISDGDYTKHAELFAPETRAHMTESVFQQGHTVITSKIGHYMEKEFSEVQKDGKYTVVVYKVRFTEEPADVTVRAVFEEIDGEMMLAGFWLDSPRLRK